MLPLLLEPLLLVGATLIDGTGSPPIEVSEDLNALASIEKVVLGGRVYDHDALLEEAARWSEEDRPQ